MRRVLWIIVSGFLICIGIGTVQVSQRIRQENLDHALIQAVKRIDPPIVERLLIAGASANARDTGEPPITLSQLMAHLLARFQHRTGGSVAAHGSTALQLLMNDGRLDWGQYRARYDAIAVSLIHHGADIHVRGIEERTLLREAARCGLHQTEALLLLRGADIGARDASGRTPLMGADAYSTSLLIERGADVHVRDVHRMNALFYAADVDVAKILIQHGAEINLTDDNGRSILYHARINERYRLVPYLKRQGARLTRREQNAQ